MSRLPRILIGFLLPALLLPTASARADSVFNRLILEKMRLEKQYGITSLECFPFRDNIGFPSDETALVRKCLSGVLTLGAALKEVPDSGLRLVGISHRFLRSGGFHSLLIPWNAAPKEIMAALRANPPPEAQKKFIAEIHRLKQQILSGLRIRQLYCTFKISNEQCMQGYRTLAEVEPGRAMSRMNWSGVAITDSHMPEKDRTIVTLKFDDDTQTMAGRLTQDPAAETWRSQKKIYRKIQEQFGDTFKALQIPNFFCHDGLNEQQCLQGAANFHQAARDPGLKNKLWGTVWVHPYNTLIKDDHDAVFRYTLDPTSIVRVLSQKPDQAQVQADVTLAEKLEKRTRNNATGLRAVCDLEGLRSSLCAQAFKTFIAFVRGNRDYRVRPPFTDIMFVDGRQLERVNFALNSKVRHLYLYVDARTSLEELAEHLSRFGSLKADRKEF